MTEYVLIMNKMSRMELSNAFGLLNLMTVEAHPNIISVVIENSTQMRLLTHAIPIETVG